MNVELAKARAEIKATKQVADSMIAECLRLTVERDAARGALDAAYASRLLTCVNDLKSALSGVVPLRSELGDEWLQLLMDVRRNRQLSSFRSPPA